MQNNFLCRLPVIPQMISAKNYLHTGCRIMDMMQVNFDFRKEAVRCARCKTIFVSPASHTADDLC